jgi:type IV pilus assembly protein PilA
MNKKGFTLIEILLVVALIAILAGIVILAINPAKQLADTRNAQRRMDVKTIVDAVYQYSIDNDGAMPSSIPTSIVCPGVWASEICKKGANCANYVDLSVLTTNSKYVVDIPFDPKSSTTDGTAYNIVKTSDNRIIVCAPFAENGVTISVER